MSAIQQTQTEKLLFKLDRIDRTIDEGQPNPTSTKEKAMIEEILSEFNREFHTHQLEKTIDMGLVIEYEDLESHVTKFVTELSGRSLGFLGLYDDCIQSFISDQCDVEHNALNEAQKH